MLGDATMTPTLAMTETGRVLLWIGVTVVLVLVGAVIAVWVRRRYRDDALGDAAPETLSLHELRELHERGGISDEEFEALKDAAVRAHQGGVAALAASKPATDVRAAPGVDLTGEPLPAPPDPGGGENPGGPASSS